MVGRRGGHGRGTSGKWIGQETGSLQAEPEIGLLLPCNVIVYEKEGKVVVSAFDPLTMSRIIENPAVHPIAAEVEAKLRRVIAAV